MKFGLLLLSGMESLQISFLFEHVQLWQLHARFITGFETQLLHGHNPPAIATCLQLIERSLVCPWSTQTQTHRCTSISGLRLVAGFLCGYNGQRGIHRDTWVHLLFISAHDKKTQRDTSLIISHHVGSFGVFINVRQGLPHFVFHLETLLLTFVVHQILSKEVRIQNKIRVNAPSFLHAKVMFRSYECCLDRGSVCIFVVGQFSHKQLIKPLTRNNGI